MTKAALSVGAIAVGLWLAIGVEAATAQFQCRTKPVDPYADMTSLEHSNIYADFEICPLAPDAPGTMRVRAQALTGNGWSSISAGKGSLVLAVEARPAPVPWHDARARCLP